ncbi:hypothetical protein HMPREF9374_2054 [Desmospora sp. 8437]|nr:hypothetical protein HMPREF9374_2054 [Desmospora sp. 8437]
MLHLTHIIPDDGLNKPWTSYLICLEVFLLSAARIMKWVSGGFEALLGIPVLGGLLVIASGYYALVVMLLLHIATLVVSASGGAPKHGSILGIVTSCVAWIPFVGMIMHIITAVILMVDAAKKEKTVIDVAS